MPFFASLASRLLMVGLLIAATSARASSCGQVLIADMGWRSATALAHIDQFILKNAFGCDAELVASDTMPGIIGMTEKGQPDIAPEFWINAAKPRIEQAVAEGRLLIAGHVFSDGGVEGFWVPAYMVDKDPSLATLQGVIKNAALFRHPEDPEASALYSCPAGWGGRITTANQYRAFKLDETRFKLVPAGSDAALAASLARAYERRQPWFGYYYGPTPALGRYKMVKVDLGVDIDMDMFTNCTIKEDCADPQPTAFPPAEVDTLVVPSFAKRNPEAYAYLQKRSFTNEQLSTIMAWMEDEQADGESTAVYVLSNYPHQWTSWLNTDAVAKVKRALAGPSR